MSYRYDTTYEVAVAGQGLKEVQESAMSPRLRKDYGPGPSEPE